MANPSFQAAQLLAGAAVLFSKSAHAQTTSSGTSSQSISTGYLAVVFGVAFGLVTVSFMMSWCMRCCVMRRRGQLGEETAGEVREDAAAEGGVAPNAAPREPSLPPVVVINPGLDVSCASLEGESLRQALEAAEAKRRQGGSGFFEIDFKDEGEVWGSTQGSNAAATAAAADASSGGNVVSRGMGGPAQPGGGQQPPQQQQQQQTGRWHWLPPFLSRSRSNARTLSSRSSSGGGGGGRVADGELGGTGAASSGAEGRLSQQAQQAPGADLQWAGPFWHEGQHLQRPGGPIVLQQRGPIVLQQRQTP